MSEQLNQALTNHLAKNNSLPKLAIVGIGNELNGDDAAGVLVVKKLKSQLPSTEKMLLIEGSIAPENFTGSIRNFRPDWIWVFDAAEMEKKPGDVELIDLDLVESVGSNTHRLPPTLFLSYLKMEINFHPFLFGINPENVEPFSEISEPIKIAIEKTTRFFLQWLRNNYNI